MNFDEIRAVDISIQLCRASNVDTQDPRQRLQISGVNDIGVVCFEVAAVQPFACFNTSRCDLLCICDGEQR